MTSFVPSRSAFVAVLLSAALVPSLRAQDETAAERRRAMLEGTDVLRRIFHDQKYDPLDSFTDLKHAPEETVVVLLGGVQRIKDIPNGARDYLRRGGALLIASHFKPNRQIDEEMLALAGVRITGHTMMLEPFAQDSGYQKRLHCPKVVPVNSGTALFRDPRGADSLLNVVANSPSCLVHSDPEAHLEPGRGRLFRVIHSLPDGITELAHLPDLCTVAPDHLREHSPLFAVGGRVEEKGRILVLADHRLFLNRMMLPEDTGNVEFAENCLKYLNPDRKPKKLLFVDRGTINPDFDVPLKPLPKLPDDIFNLIANFLGQRLLDADAKTIQFEEEMTRFEENNGFNRKLWALMAAKNITPTDLAKWAMLVGSLLFLAWGLFRVGGSRYRLAASTPLLSRFVSRHRPDSPLAVRRQRELLAGDSLYEPARTLARETFAAAGVPVPRLGQASPRIETTVRFWRGWRLRRLARRLWALAFDAVPQAVPRSAWPALQRDLDELKTALGTGIVRVV
jgi:hypothetical protein